MNPQTSDWTLIERQIKVNVGAGERIVRRRAVRDHRRQPILFNFHAHGKKTGLGTLIAVFNDIHGHFFKGYLKRTPIFIGHSG